MVAAQSTCRTYAERDVVTENASKGSHKEKKGGCVHICCLCFFAKVDRADFK